MADSAKDILWSPSPSRQASTHMRAFIDRVSAHSAPSVVDWPSLYDYSITQPEAFWSDLWAYCGVIDETGVGVPPSPVTAHWGQMPGTTWFPTAQLSYAENLLKRRDDGVAVVFADESGARRTLSHAELYQAVAQLANALKAQGVKPGDRVAGWLPNIPETVVGCLAANAIGAVWSSCSPDFGVRGVLDRLGQIEPVVLICANAYRYNGKVHDCLDKVSEAVNALASVHTVVVVEHIPDHPNTLATDNAVDYSAWVADQPKAIEFLRLPFDHPLYILYSSGTTGVPKCIVHGQGGSLLQHLKELVLHTDLKANERMLYFTTCGWMMWNWLLSALAAEATIVLYEGSPFYPDGNVLWDLIDEWDIDVFGTSAKWIAACDKAGIRPATTHRLSALKAILSTGSPLLPESFDYVYEDIKADVQLASISGGTDIVSCFALGNPLKPVIKGELQSPGLGMKVEIRNDQGEVVVNETGELTCSMPFPSMPVGFWRDDDGRRYQSAYFETHPGVWSHGDYACLTDRGGLIIQGRSDATLNPGGVRIGTAEIYRQVDQVDEVLESVCVGQEFDGDVRVVLFVVLRPGLELDQALIDAIKRQIRQNTTPRHVPAVVCQVPDIPKTVSGKITELAVRDVIHGRPVKNTSALANPNALDFFKNRPELKG
ncbi:MAG: acetoacetate--CoA ligase [Wenzhouxiangella sp.]|nr:acetoacetate--CoA ligase [Wenzhouxiangella sp.]